LEQLDLGHNQMERIEPDVFSGLLKLKKLNLDHNQLSNWDFYSKKMCSLEYLSLCHNKIDSCDAKQITISSLRVLNLSENRLTSLSANAFFGLSSLVSLILRKNNIATIEIGAFNGLYNLRYLSLAQNSYDSFNLSKLFFYQDWCFLNLMVLDLDMMCITTAPFSVGTQALTNDEKSLFGLIEMVLSKCRNRVIFRTNNRFWVNRLLQPLTTKGLLNLLGI
jgi:hypothetical protein